MKRFAIATLVAALVAAPAFAQTRGPKTTRTDAQKRMDAEIDKAYQNAIRASGNKGPAKPADPWGSVRPAGAGGDKR